MEITTEQPSLKEAEHTTGLTIIGLKENEFATKASKHALLGKLLTEKTLGKRVIRGMIKKGWGDPEGLTISDVSPNTFLFNFASSETACRILEDAPWNILGHVLILKQWNSHVPIHEVDFTHTPYWIQIEGLPLDLFSYQNVVRIGSTLGEVLDAEEPFNGTLINRSFLRVKVSVDINSPLITGFWVPREHHP